MVNLIAVTTLAAVMFTLLLANNIELKTNYFYTLGIRNFISYFA